VKRTPDNCKLVKKYGKPDMTDERCDGFQKSEIDDEPCNTCMECKWNTFYEGEEDGK
jgi:hypothetical protein